MASLFVVKNNDEEGEVMNHVIAIVIKFVTGIIAYTLALDLFFDATWVDIVTFSLLMTIVTYLLGDIILLPRIGNGNSLIADFLLSYMLVWIFGSVLLDNYIQIGWEVLFLPRLSL